MDLNIPKCCESEKWTDLMGFNGMYRISSCGRVATCKQRGGSKLTDKTDQVATHYRLLNLHKTLKHRGHQCHQVYLYKSNTRQVKTVHRLVYSSFVSDVPSDKVVDHINRDSLDNHLSNLRLASQAENQINSSNLRRGVYSKVLKSGVAKYYANITVKGKQTILGVFDSFDEAYTERQKAEKLFYPGFSSK